MKTKTDLRENGAIGAILDEYEKALNDFITVIKEVSNEELVTIVDLETNDEDCKSIQTILTHVIQSGYTYAIEVRKWLGEAVLYKEKEFYTTIEAYELALKEMFAFNEQLFLEYPKVIMIAHEVEGKIKVRWGQLYDVEQLFEHAIVHILRHRRQIERFKLKLQEK